LNTVDDVDGVHAVAGPIRPHCTSAGQPVSLVHTTTRQPRWLRLHMDHCNYITLSPEQKLSNTRYAVAESLVNGIELRQNNFEQFAHDNENYI